MSPVDRRSREIGAALEGGAPVLTPFVDGLGEAVRRGGRLLLFGEGRLHLLAQHAAYEIVGRRHRSGLVLPSDALDTSSLDPHAIARRVGPLDAILAIAATAEEPLFALTLEAAKARGARIYCLCLARAARVEGRVTLAIDVPESRPHHVPGHLAMILNFIAKRVLEAYGSNPLLRPTRLDGGAPRPTSQSGTHPSAPRAAGPAPQPEASPAEAAGPAAEGRASPTATGTGAGDPHSSDVTELVLTLEPDGGRDAEAAPARERAASPSTAPLDRPPAEAMAGASPRGQSLAPLVPDERGLVRLIQFRCEGCREAILAGPLGAGERARCPFCGKRLRVPRAEGRLYRTGQTTLAQVARPVSRSFALVDCRLAIVLQGGLVCPAVAEDLTPEGIEASLEVGDARRLEVGSTVELRFEAPAFLEPLVAQATVERLLPPGAEGGERPDRVRALLPLHDDAPREVRVKLARLAGVTASESGRIPVPTRKAVDQG